MPERGLFISCQEIIGEDIRRFVLGIPKVAFVNIRSSGDLALLKECEASTSIADKLIGLELIVRRWEERCH